MNIFPFFFVRLERSSNVKRGIITGGSGKITGEQGGIPEAACDSLCFLEKGVLGNTKGGELKLQHST